MWTHGHFYWNELNTRDPERACAFYADRLGWTYETMPMDDGSDYVVARMGDNMVGGIFRIGGAEFEGVPDHWFAYVAVDDVDARAAGVEAAGGAIVRPAFDVPGIGRIVIVQDPTGAVVGWITPVAME